jgi:regulator of RNase E activity RraA
MGWAIRPGDLPHGDENGLVLVLSEIDCAAPFEAERVQAAELADRRGHLGRAHGRGWPSNELHRDSLRRPALAGAVPSNNHRLARTF